MKNFLISLATICLSFFITGFILNSSNVKGKSTNKIASEEKSSDKNNDLLNNEAQPSELKDNDVDFSNILADYDTWKTYNKENIYLATDFIGVDIEGNEITKKDFLEKLKTGNYAPVKLYDAEHMYQLHRFNASKNLKVSKAIKSNADLTYKYYLKEGKSFPNFKFKDLNGNSFTKNDLLGNTVVIKCWFIQCKTCVEEFPKINELYDRYESHNNVVFLSLAFDKPDKLKKFLTKKEFRYPVIAEQKKFMQNEMGIVQYPTHIIIDQYGDIKKMVNSIDSLILALDSTENEEILNIEDEI